jgi:aryl-alcohol dehydrogenase-like predicted oxidoreductase
MRSTLFGRSGLRVSEYCLGTMTFGTEWALGADYDTSKAVFDTYTKAGGYFLDTANRYTNGTSERWLGEFIADDRDHFVVATKYTLSDRDGDVHFAGNHRKNMMRSVRDSLQRLNTEYIDVFWLHMWDFTTPVDEIMRGLDDLISRGLVHYIGISDTPAWIVSQANVMAELRGWSQFVGLQIEYSLIQRAPERDLLPMAKQFGMSVTPWGVLGGGALSGKYINTDKGTAPGRIPENSARRSERANRIAETTVAVAKELEVAPTAVALAWAKRLHQSVIPIIGARTPEQLSNTLENGNLILPQSAIDRLNEVSAIELGFPHDFLVSDGVKGAMGNTIEKIIR